MTPVEARRLGNILTGAIIEADQESVEVAFSALADLRVTLHSYIIPKAIAGKAIEDLPDSGEDWNDRYRCFKK